MKHRRFSAESKTKVAIEAIRGFKTLNELSSEYEVHPNQISNWKKQLLTQASQIFKDRQNEDRNKGDKRVENLYKEIGKFQGEWNW